MTRKMQCDHDAVQPLQIQIPDDIAQMVEHLSEASGSRPEELVVSALRAKFAPIPKDLDSLFQDWEQASEYDAARCATFRGDL
jgi:hypothetical protein